MAEEVVSRSARKEPEVLTDASLLLLANGIGKQDLKGVELAMYLNIPTTTIVRIIGDITDAFLTSEGSENDRMSVTAKCMLLWKEMTKEKKNRERVKCLEKALRDIGKGEVADNFVERHSNNQELSSEIFT